MFAPIQGRLEESISCCCHMTTTHSPIHSNSSIHSFTDSLKATLKLPKMHYYFALSVCCYQLRRMQIIIICKWKCQSYIVMRNGWSLLENKSQNYVFFVDVLEAIVGDGKNGKQITWQRLNNCARTFTEAKHKTNEMKTKSFVFFPLALASAERRLQRIPCMNKIFGFGKTQKENPPFSNELL